MSIVDNLCTLSNVFNSCFCHYRGVDRETANCFFFQFKSESRFNSLTLTKTFSCIIFTVLQTEPVVSDLKTPTNDTEFDPYVCSLNSHFKQIAKEELREDENIRNQALAQFREWIAKHPHIKRCRTDSVFLLRFLRVKKFSLQPACEMLEKYLTIRQLYPQWFRNLDIEDKALEEIIDMGYVVPLLERDENGRQLILTCAGKFDPYRFTSAQMARAHSLVTEALLDDEESQVAGYSHINDEEGLSMGLLSLWSLTDIRAMLKCIQVNYLYFNFE